MMPPWLLARTLIMALFFSCLTPGSLNPCIEVVPNITYQCMDQKLSKVPDDIPSSTKNIDLSFNPLKILKSYSFSNFSELQWLDFQHSTLKRVTEFSAFLSLEKLLYLDISYTNTKIDFDGIFLGLTSLNTLKMAGNSFKDNTLSNVFANTTNLTFLDLSKCQLEQISWGVFDTLHRLQLLNMSHNNLLFLDSSHYNQLYSLSTLDCSFNRIETSKGILQHFPKSLAFFNLTNNSVACICEHQKFLQWVKEQKQFLVNVEQMTCATPVEMNTSLVLDFNNSTCYMYKTIISVSVVSVIVVSTVAFLIYHFYFHLILIAGCKKYSRGESIYDAFVIYSSLFAINKCYSSPGALLWTESPWNTWLLSYSMDLTGQKEVALTPSFPGV